MLSVLLVINYPPTGPVLIERLYHITVEDPERAHEASLEALRHLDKVEQCSPYIDHFISKLNPQTEQDVQLVSKYIDSSWALETKNSRNKRLKSIGNDSWYHEVNLGKNIDIARVYCYNKQYLEAQSTLGNSNPSCELASKAAEIALLQQNYSLVAAQNKKAEAFLTTSLSNELYTKNLTATEVQYYWKVKLLNVFTNFLRNSYKEVWTGIYDLVLRPAITASNGEQISACDVLNQPKLNRFVSREEIVLATVLSILLSRPNNELNDVLKEEAFIKLVGTKIEQVQPLFSSLRDANFIELKTHIDNLNSFAVNNYFFSKNWKTITLAFRQKSYNLYLSLITRVTAQHLSDKLGIEKDTLIKEIKDLIKKLDLHIDFIESEEIFVKIEHDKNDEYIERLENLTGKIDNIEASIKEKLDFTKNQFQTPQLATIIQNLE